MGTPREIIKTATKKIGIYNWIRNKKDLTYRTVRDSKLAIRFSLNHLFHDRINEVSLFLKEFDNENILGYIDSELAKDDNPLHGASCPLNLRALYVLCRIIKPEVAVETGVASGTSSFVILNAMDKNDKGHLYSIDLPPQDWEKDNTNYRTVDRVMLTEGKMPGWIVPGNLRRRWDLIIGDTKKELKPLLQKLGGIDMFYHDAEHTREAMLWEYRTAWPYISKQGVLCSDDVTWNTAFDEFKKEISNQGQGRRWFGFGMICKK